MNSCQLPGRDRKMPRHVGRTSFNDAGLLHSESPCPWPCLAPAVCRFPVRNIWGPPSLQRKKSSADGHAVQGSGLPASSGEWAGPSQTLPMGRELGLVPPTRSPPGGGERGNPDMGWGSVKASVGVKQRLLTKFLFIVFS